MKTNSIYIRKARDVVWNTYLAEKTGIPEGTVKHYNMECSRRYDSYDKSKTIYKAWREWTIWVMKEWDKHFNL